MEHFYREVEGCFTWPLFYSRLVDELKAKNRPTVGVELGTLNGQSLAYFAVECLSKGVDCKIDGVDMRNDNGVAAGNLQSVRSVVRTLHSCLSWDAAKLYEDESLDFVFIDAEHDYKSVTKDIAAWRGKVRKGGLICGHDYSQDYAGLMLAVTEAFESWSVDRGEKYPGAANLSPHGRQYFPVWSVRL